ncbi:MAG: bifunctional homocysteine S-methyltransferase/methylenetetrahydrofolate reductase [bacterium]
MSQPRGKEFLELIRQRVLICDGAMGTMLYARGHSYRSCFDELCETQPFAVEILHREYIGAGADVIETNTFGANPIRLAEHGLEKRAKEINRAGARIARKAATAKVFVAGAVGPLSKQLEPIGTLSLSDAREAFRIQITGLVEGGVDLLIFETFSSLQEIHEAMAAARELCDLPIIAQMTFTEEAKTIVGDKPAEVYQALRQWGADVIGINCSVGPHGVMEVVERFPASEEVILSAQPNAGLPRIIGGRYIYLASPQYFADYAVKFAERGVGLIGGCCGTTPEHIATVAHAIGSRKRSRPSPILVRELVEEAPVKAAVPPRITSPFRENLGKRFMISVEIDPPRSADAEPFIRSATYLKASGIDLINVADSPLARARMSALAMAYLIRQEAGVEVLLHMSCRDRNALALQSELLGAHALGLCNILAVTGDPPSVGDYPFAKAVFELDSIGLAHLISRLNEGVDLTGRPLAEPTSFFFGVAVNPTALDMKEEWTRLEKKVEAGACFAFTQPLFDARTLEAFLQQAEPLRLPIFAGILPLRSARHAEFLHNEIPDITIPESVRQRMHDAGERGAEVGIEIAREFLKIARPMVQGVYLMPPFNKFEMAVKVIEGLEPN